MWLELHGIRVNPQHPADIAKLRALGYQVVDVPLPEPTSKPVRQPAPTPEQANQDAIREVNESPTKSKGKG